jgi:GNAT superfamily N-acetyltransferase
VFRDAPRAADPGAVRAIVSSTGFFRESEVAIAVELIEERLSQGLASEYHFMFADAAPGTTVGYTCFGPIPGAEGSVDLYWIAVHAAQQGRGLGRALLAQTERRIAAGVPDAHGAVVRGRRIYIETAGQRRYEPTRAFYTSCGYREEARLVDFYAPGDDKLIYVKALPR